jgi:hypothetical protein
VLPYTYVLLFYDKREDRHFKISVSADHFLHSPGILRWRICIRRYCVNINWTFELSKESENTGKNLYKVFCQLYNQWQSRGIVWSTQKIFGLQGFSLTQSNSFGLCPWSNFFNTCLKPALFPSSDEEASSLVDSLHRAIPSHLPVTDISFI